MKQASVSTDISRSLRWVSTTQRLFVLYTWYLRYWLFSMQFSGCAGCSVLFQKKSHARWKPAWVAKIQFSEKHKPFNRISSLSRPSQFEPMQTLFRFQLWTGKSGLLVLCGALNKSLIRLCCCFFISRVHVLTRNNGEKERRMWIIVLEEI